MEFEIEKINDPAFVSSYIDESLKTKDELHVDNLIYVLKNTSNYAIPNPIALALADIGDKAAVPALMEVISRPNMYNHNGTLVYACGELGDMTKHVSFFADVIINSAFEASWTATYLFDEMKGPFEKKELLDILEKIKGASVHPDNESFVKALKGWVKRRLKD